LGGTKFSTQKIAKNYWCLWVANPLGLAFRAGRRGGMFAGGRRPGERDRIKNFSPGLWIWAAVWGALRGALLKFVLIVKKLLFYMVWYGTGCTFRHQGLFQTSGSPPHRKTWPHWLGGLGGARGHLPIFARLIGARPTASLGGAFGRGILFFKRLGR